MKRIIVIIAVACTAVVTHAQKNVNKAIDDLITDKSAVTVISDKYEHGEGADATYCYYTVLQIDKGQSAKIDRLQEAFNKDAPVAYRFIYQTPQHRAERSKVVYGPELEYSILFGTKKDHNYRLLFVNDSKYPDKRYVYAMVWYKEDGGIRCLLYRIYGKNPAKVSKKSSRSVSLYGLPDISGHLQVGDGIVVDGDQWQIIDSNNTITVKRGADDKSQDVSIGDRSIGKIETDCDFMMQFGYLRAAFLDAVKHIQEQRALPTGIAVKLLTLCKEHVGLLSENERITCQRSIMEMKREMQKADPDAFLDGLLGEAMLALKK